jgi:O-antigen/teichoic acid export membrane protein
VGRIVSWVAHLAVCLRRYPYLRDHHIAVHFGTMRPLLRFGGWTTVTNVVSPMMNYLDRFLIGVLLPMAAVAHYVTPYELVTKLLVVPSAVLAATFPAFAATFACDREAMVHVYDRALRGVVLVTFPIILAAIALAHEGMAAWMGRAVPPQSATVLQWLAFGVFINGVAQTPYSALQGAGRPDLIAKLHVLELPFYVASILFLARSAGLVGVAMAWTLRVTIDAIALLVIARRSLQLPIVPRLGSAWILPLMLATLIGAAFAPTSAVRISYVVIVGAVFAATAWRGVLTTNERDVLLSWIRSPRAVEVAATTEPIA